MWKIISTTFLFLLAGSLEAQIDSVPAPKSKPISKYQRIAAARGELLAAFLNDDPAGAGLWRDSLTSLEDRNYVGLAWDERWLLYYWEEAYGNLFEETSRFDAQEREIQALKIQPPDDSLYEWIDYGLFERRYELFQNISKGFLTEEERIFATLQLEYLLRMNSNKEEWNTKVDAFLKRYPNSRFTEYLKTTKTKVLKAGSRALTIDVLFTSGSWRGELGRTLNPNFGVDVGLAYWFNRWNVGLHCSFGGQKLSHSIIHRVDNFDYDWLKGDRSNFFTPELEFGFDMINNKKIRVSPAIGGGLHILKSPVPNEEHEDPLPDYYELFSFTNVHWFATLTTDVKFPVKDPEDADLPPGSYNAVRLRLGYRDLNLGGQNPFLEGNMFFFSVGYALFAYQAVGGGH